MSIDEDTINPIINFFHKLLGNNLWIIPVSVGIASWCIYCIYPDKWIVLYVAITCSVIAVLHICSNLCLWIKKTIKKHKEKAVAKELAIHRREQEFAANERRNLEYASAIWKLVAHIDNNLIEAATMFLSLEIHDEDKHVRL